MPAITEGSSGQTASLVFTLVISAPTKPGNVTNTAAGTERSYYFKLAGVTSL
jgi:hypothetical protein